MPKKNNNSKKKNNLFKNFISQENSQILIGWLILLFNILLIIFIFSEGGTLSSGIKNFFTQIFGWSIYFFIFFIFFVSYILFQKYPWFKIYKNIIGGLIIFLTLNLYIHFIFREGGILGSLILSLSSYIGNYGLVLVSLLILNFGLWLIFEDKFFIFLKSVFQKSKENIEKLEEKINFSESKFQQEPIKNVRREINYQTSADIKIKEKEKSKLKTKKTLPKSIWRLPPLDLLSQGKEEVLAPDIKSTSQIIQKTLENFGIKIEVVEVEIGPAITRFGLKPGEGVKLSKILSYQSDLALALGTPNLIIETPIPGKAVLGIQVPNKKSAVVKLGNILKEKEFSEGSLFTFPVGRKINGEAYFADLAKMPHLLIAGTTGSGKSIFIHNILISFLMKNSPDTLNLILIDPKRVELITYSDLPHLIMDPIIDVKKTLAVFNWLIEEMEERYKLLQESKSRDINSYNQKQIIKKDKLMPRIVLVIDELADLMITFGANIESMIIRLTQMARATGIHLILATQRPSVDIVTGLIKANIPNRICFKVASYVDSRTVLDISGAEKLMGTGDGLFISTSTLRPLRIKAPYVSENEIAKVIKFWSDQAEELPQFEKQTIPLEEIEKKTVYLQENEDDDYLLKEAIEIILEANKASTSLLQRRLKIGYARAARILDLLEQKGIVGPQEGSKPRKILITKEELDNF
jgi:S-DNA-T family DNA segregation ATPase FtsK/SpoIIIE